MLFYLTLLFFLLNFHIFESKLSPLKPSEEYKFSLNVDEQDESVYKIYWKLIENDKKIQFELHCRTSGWVGFGLSPNGGMPGSDIAIGWVDKNGQGHLKDTYATGKSTPLIDKEQNWDLIDSKEENGYTILKIKRDLITCDSNKQDFDIKLETQRLIFAWNNKDPETGINDWAFHENNRKIKSAVLMNTVDETSSSDAQSEVTQTYELRLNNHPLPDKETYYYCKLFTIAPLDADLHLIAYDVLIEKESLDYMHHFDTYICEPDDLSKINSTLSNIGYECGPGGDSASEQDLLKDICTKRSMIFAWAVGGKRTIFFPDDTGFRFPKSNKESLIFINFHFDNSIKNKNRIDNSGIRLKFTKNLRKHDLGVMVMAVPTDPFAIQLPPNSDTIKLSTYCYSDCTQKFIPDDGITVFAGNFHTHLQGRALRTSLIRDGKLIQYLFDDQNYDFNYQANMIINPTKLYKGDTLVLECSYNTKNKNNYTFGGYATEEEMCGNFIYYYPKMELNGCISRFNQFEFAKLYKNLIDKSLIASFDLNTINDPSKAKVIMNHLINTVKPSDELTSIYKSFYENPIDQLGLCTLGSRSNSIVFNKSYTRPKDDLKVEDYCASKNNANTLKNIYLSIIILISFKFLF